MVNGAASEAFLRWKYVDDLTFGEVVNAKTDCCSQLQKDLDGLDIQPLGLESGLIKDSQITASSYHVDNRLPEFGRLNYDNYWAPATNDYITYHWLQVDFLSAVAIQGIKVQGSGFLQQWVTHLSIKTGNDENSLAPVMESGIEKQM
ncbi:retinoschisin-like [Amphiura filiformis]|uniref:retinoschisin-like n=1 Tax=Amphiura filiformis TaxID=82378 RepID=UPI003B21DA26